MGGWGGKLHANLAEPSPSTCVGTLDAHGLFLVQLPARMLVTVVDLRDEEVAKYHVDVESAFQNGQLNHCAFKSIRRTRSPRPYMLNLSTENSQSVRSHLAST